MAMTLGSRGTSLQPVLNWELMSLVYGLSCINLGVYATCSRELLKVGELGSCKKTESRGDNAKRESTVTNQSQHNLFVPVICGPSTDRFL